MDVHSGDYTINMFYIFNKSQKVTYMNKLINISHDYVYFKEMGLISELSGLFRCRYSFMLTTFMIDSNNGSFY